MAIVSAIIIEWIIAVMVAIIIAFIDVLLWLGFGEYRPQVCYRHHSCHHDGHFCHHWHFCHQFCHFGLTREEKGLIRSIIRS